MNAAAYEEVEADRGATAQAVVLVLLTSLAAGIGLAEPGQRSLQAAAAGMIGGLVGWVAWAMLTYLIGTRLLPGPRTRADLGELLRTLAFASAPGLLRVLGVVPGLRFPVFVVASLWMLAAMVVAVRQALDYSSTARALGVCVVGWGLSLAIAALMGNFFVRSVS